MSVPTYQPAVITGADPVYAPPAPAPVAVPRFTEADLETARAQEKSKVYDRLEQLQQEVLRLKAADDQYAAERQAALDLANAETERQRAAAEAAANAELSARELFEKQNSEWENRFAEMQRQQELDRQILAKEQEFRNLENYILQAKAANAETIMPHLMNLVSGNTYEEVDASIAGLIATSDAILEDVRESQSTSRANQQGTRAYGGPAAVPLENYTPQETDFAAVGEMDMATWRTERAKYIKSSPTARGLLS